MKNLLLTLITLAVAFTANAQQRLLYESFTDGSSDTSRTLVTVNNDQLCIASANPEEPNPIPGIAKHYTYIDYAHDTAFYQLYYTEKEQYFTGISLHTGNDYQFEKVMKSLKKMMVGYEYRGVHRKSRIHREKL